MSVKTIIINLGECDSQEKHGFSLISGINGDAAELILEEDESKTMQKYRFSAKLEARVVAAGVFDSYLTPEDYTSILIPKVRDSLIASGVLLFDEDNGICTMA